MRVTAVDHHKDLFYIEDFYPNWLLCLLSNPHKFSYEEVIVENKPVRRNLSIPFWLNTVLMFVSKIRCWQISKELNRQIFLKDIGVWFDVENYFMNKHTDHLNHVEIGMQIYLSNGLKDLGTCFYNKDGSVRHTFKYIKNTGYMMINNHNQVHAMPIPVPKDNLRLSVYHWIYYDRH